MHKSPWHSQVIQKERTNENKNFQYRCNTRMDREVIVKIFIGIDNGVTGSIGILDETGKLLHFGPVPTFSQTSYTKTKMRQRTRISTETLYLKLYEVFSMFITIEVRCFIERPMINATRFIPSMSAMAALEATLIVLERLGLGYQYVDSKTWQKVLLPGVQNIKGNKEQATKIASRDIGTRMFPSVAGVHTDCDGLLIAEWARRSNL